MPTFFSAVTSEVFRVAEGNKVAARFVLRGAHRGTGGNLIPARRSVLNQGG